MINETRQMLGAAAAAPTGALAHVSSKSRRSRTLPRGTPCRSPGLLLSDLLRRARPAQVADTQHTGRVLVGDHHHDYGRIRRQGSTRADGKTGWNGVCHLRSADALHTGAHHNGAFQPVLRVQDWTWQERLTLLIDRPVFFHFSIFYRLERSLGRFRLQAEIVL